MTSAGKKTSIVESYISLLVDEGVRQATLQAVADRSGYSKAGLIHHFPSRAALDEGLLHQLQSLVEADLDAMAKSHDPVEYYLRTSVQTTSDLERTVLAATRLAQQNHPLAQEALRTARNRWLGLLESSLGDPALALLALLAGDGMSHQVDIAGGLPEEILEPASVARVGALIASLASVPSP